MGYFNQELNDIGLRIFDTPQSLMPYVEQIWVANAKKLNKPISNKILSDGRSAIIINFSEPYSIEMNNSVKTINDKYIYIGVTEYPVSINFEKSVSAIGIMFSPYGAYKFFQKNMYHYKDKIANLNDLLFQNFELLHNKLSLNEKLETKITLIEHFFLEMIEKSPKNNSSWIASIVAYILLKKGDVSVKELCDQFNIGQRQCERGFKNEVGVGPKSFSRMIRVKNAKSILSSLESDSLIEVSYESGFFDQAHFIREFKYFMKERPKDYLSRKKEMAKLLNFKKYRE